MILSSENFEIIMGNGDMLYLDDVYSKPDISKQYWGEMINSEDFLRKAGKILLELAEEEYRLGNIKIYK